ncbi:MAG: glucose-6-phosphate isomerase [Erysipelotrichaceae bacterium]|jgi:glucose-6-phosphate isomerase|nr:glucose-6-phosphate isomerase [Erysipelotrichaceae bacterium]
MIRINLDYLKEQPQFDTYQERIKKIHQGMNDLSLPGNDFLGWATLPLNLDHNEIEQIKKTAQEIRSRVDILVVVGIGGSYLGARAVIEALNGLRPLAKKPEIIFLGQTFSSTYTAQVLSYLQGKKFAINVISKSGTTTETSIAFRLVRNLLISQVGKDAARNLIVATTDKNKGVLRNLSLKEGYQMFVLPENIGGRYSVFTPVGLLPIAVAGINIDDLLAGALNGYQRYNNADLESAANRYAITRNALYQANKKVELFVTYEPQLHELQEWFKQLFGESEGKEHQGIFPTAATFSTDLHSLGQFIQEGSPLLFETILNIKQPVLNLSIPHDDDNLDELNYLAGKTLNEVNEKAMMGTLEAHSHTGRVNNIILEIPDLTTKTLGELLYFFMYACAVSSYLLEVNPFDQPGVEVYKKNMFKLLGKK